MLRHMLLYAPMQSDLWCLYDDVYHMVSYVMPYDVTPNSCACNMPNNAGDWTDDASFIWQILSSI